MTKEISKTVVGAFVISAIGLIVVGVLVFGSGKLFKDTDEYVLFFEGSVKGLNVGSPVMWRGVKIGSVQEVILLADPQAMTMQIPVIIEIDRSRVQVKGKRSEEDINTKMARLIKHGLRARLTTQSFVTGQLMIDLDLDPDIPVQLVGSDMPYPEIPTMPSTLERLAETLQQLPIVKIFDTLEQTVSNIEEITGDPGLKEIVAVLKTAVDNTNTLLKNADTLVVNVDNQIAPITQSISKTTDEAQQLLQSVDRQVVPVTKSITNTAEEAQHLLATVEDQIEQLSASIQTAAESADAALVQAKVTLESFDGVEESPLAFELEKAFKELSSAARAIRSLADFAERYPDSLIRGKAMGGGKK